MSRSGSESHTITWLFEGVCARDEAKTAEFWELFFPRLVRFANRVMAQSFGIATDAEDVAQTALVEFWRKAVAGGLNLLKDRESIWAVLASMTKREAIDTIRQATAWKRGGRHRTVSLEGIEPDDSRIGQLSFHEFDLVLEELLGSLDERDQAILVGKLIGCTDREIARFLGCSERFVRQRIQVVRKQWSWDS